MYASNNYRERVELWEWCCVHLPKILWVIVGDFNMVEHRIDKSGGLTHSWKGNEMYFWHKFKRKFNLLDPMEHMHGKFHDIWCTWCNNQRGKQRVYCRLDRVYGDVSVVSFIQEDSHAPIQVVPASLSNHSPIHTCCRIEVNGNVQVFKRNHNSFKLNSMLLDDPNNVDAIVMVTKIIRIGNPLLDPIELWNLKVDTWKNLLQAIGKKLAMDRNK